MPNSESHKRIGGWSRFLTDYWPAIALVISNGFSVLSGALLLQPHARLTHLVHNVWAWIFGLSLAGTAVATILVTNRQQRVSGLEERVRDLEDQVDQKAEDYYQRLENELRQFSTACSFTSNERVTVYKHAGDDFFVRLGRYSDGPAYKKPGRPAYPDDRGFLGRAWQTGAVFQNGLPDPVRESNAYWKAQKDSGVAKGVAKKFHMKSRTYAAIRMKYGKENETGCVLMIESTRVSIFDEEAIMTKLRGPDGERVRSFLETNRRSEPGFDPPSEGGD